MYPEFLYPECLHAERQHADPVACPSRRGSVAGSSIARSVVVRILWSLLLLPVLIGCESEKGIVTYKIPTKIPEQLRPGNERLLAIMVPRGENVWYFKIKGPEKAVDLVADDFKRFVVDVQFNEREEPELKPLPDGWKLGGKKQMRFASVDITTPSKQLDLSISSLPVFGEWDAYVLQNVNRWRGQVSMDPTDEKWGGGKPIEIASAEGDSVLVDLVGAAGDGGMSGGMAGAGPKGPFMNAPFAGGAAGGGAGNGAGGPPKANPPAQPSSSANTFDLKYEQPDGWRDGKMSAMREAAFSVGPEDAAAEVTIIRAGGDVRGNVARWMGQVSGSPPDETALETMMENAEKLTVSGLDGQRFIIAGDAEKDQTSIDATLVPLESGMTLFVKMTGPPQTVVDQSDSMRTFLESLSF